jgi:lipid-A-disaccharide synthase-like uncharacterized protein
MEIMCLKNLRRVSDWHLIGKIEEVLFTDR